MAGEAIPDMLTADYQEARKDEAQDAEARKREEDERTHEQLVSGGAAGRNDASGGDNDAGAHDALRIDNHDALRVDTHDVHELTAVKREAEKQVEKVASKMPKADKAI
jgi:hypothetical protein